MAKSPDSGARRLGSVLAVTRAGSVNLEQFIYLSHLSLLNRETRFLVVTTL